MALVGFDGIERLAERSAALVAVLGATSVNAIALTVFLWPSHERCGAVPMGDTVVLANEAPPIEPFTADMIERLSDQCELERRDNQVATGLIASGWLLPPLAGLVAHRATARSSRSEAEKTPAPV